MNSLFKYISLCLVLSAAGGVPPNAFGQDARKEAAEVFEKGRIERGLAKLGVGADWQIVVADNCELVEKTAAQEMQRLLRKASFAVDIVPESEATTTKRIILGREANVRAVRDMGTKGLIDLRNVTAEDDGFHLRRVGQDIVVAGSNSRGILYGVYALEDFINAGANGVLDVRRVPYYRKRGSAPGYYWNSYDNLLTEDFSEEKAAYLARLGVNQLTLNYAGILTSYVKSDVFPFQKSPNAELQRKLKVMSEACEKYGLDYYMMLTLPILPTEDGNLADYPPEALGTVKRPWGGDANGLSRTLCVNSPIVQEHLRNIIRKLVREYPAVKGAYVYNMDIASWICTPELCERCAVACTDSPPDVYNPWESQAKMVTLLAEAAHEENPHFDLRFWGTVHYPEERIEKLLRGAQGYDSLITAWHGNDHDVMVPDVAEPTLYFSITQKICEERGIPLYVPFEFNNLESIPRSLPFPFHVSDSLRKHKNWGTRHIEEHAGPIVAHNPVNALAMREFQWDPDQAPDKVLASLSSRQFGPAAGKRVYEAWLEMEKAMDVWDDMPKNPLSGSLTFLSIGTPAGVPRAILPDVAKYYDDCVQIYSRVEPWLAPEFSKFKEKAFLEKMERMNVHLSRAAQHAKDAVAVASDREFIEISYYDGEFGRPTRKEYAELNHGPIAIADALCRQRVNIIRAYHLLTELENARARGDAESVRKQEQQYHDLVRADIALQEQFCELLMGFLEMQPCYTRTSLTEREIRDLLSGTKKKIEKLREFLATI